MPQYENLYANGAYLPSKEKERLGKLVKGWGGNRRRRPPRRPARRREATEPVQGSLF
jgi:hypothetical protein